MPESSLLVVPMLDASDSEVDVGPTVTVLTWPPMVWMSTVLLGPAVVVESVEDVV